ncbi:MAG: hypothetical protein O3B01_09700 [Planctomycetota bacterium]|nr:hypothetical protein [Planctomycetota bacterium]MDA1138843.1 hypothetical protein [Planctomycetota bacterium]
MKPSQIIQCANVTATQGKLDWWGIARFHSRIILAEDQFNKVIDQKRRDKGTALADEFFKPE